MTFFVSLKIKDYGHKHQILHRKTSDSLFKMLHYFKGDAVNQGSVCSVAKLQECTTTHEMSDFQQSSSSRRSSNIAKLTPSLFQCNKPSLTHSHT
jgi:hypothetical protein